MDASLIEKLGELGLAQWHHVFDPWRSIQNLIDVHADDAKLDELRDDLKDAGADRDAIKKLATWIRENRPCRQNVRFAPRQDVPAHLYGLPERLNRDDLSRVEESTLLRVDIEPFTGAEENPHFSIQVPRHVLHNLIREASTNPVPVVSLLGPTGVGKSTLASSFLGQSPQKPQNHLPLPVVAQRDQHQPTSAHVSVYKGCLGADSMPFVLLDFEGEDGRVPRTLIEKGLHKMSKMSSLLSAGFSTDAFKAEMEKLTRQRQVVVKEMLPPLAYLLSDVVVFVDTVEPRRTERSDRIMKFAQQAHECVSSLGWKPALIILQNKWHREDEQQDRFDITKEYDWVLEQLSSMFSGVSVLRVPGMTDRHWFEAGLNSFHTELSQGIQMVQQQRSAPRLSEREFWFHFQSMADQFRQVHPKGLKSLDTIVSNSCVSADAADNALWAFKRLRNTEPTLTPDNFQECADTVLKWYAYSHAQSARFAGTDEALSRKKEGLQRLHKKVLRTLEKHEPCRSKLEHGGKIYRCTQLSGHHDRTHRNPAMIPTESQNLLKRILRWKDLKPCVWQGHFEAVHDLTYSFEVFRRIFDSYMDMTVEDYLKAFPAASCMREIRDYSTGGQSLCGLCLAVKTDLILLEAGVCRHSICRQCVDARIALQGEKTVTCPFCHEKSKVLFQSDTESLPLRILSLDGGGVRGLIEVLVLMKVEGIFAPLPVTSLFDVIIGTSAGGIISMALLHGIPLQTLKEFLESFAREILDADPFASAFRRFIGQSACSSASFDRALQSLFGDSHLRGYKSTIPPYVFCTAYDVENKQTDIIGNFPHGWRLSHRTLAVELPLWQAARASAAAPTFFDPMQMTMIRTDPTPDNGPTIDSQILSTYVDGGIEANCPASLGVKVATEMQLHKKGIEESFVDLVASIGTGLPFPSVAVTDGNILHWAGELFNLATSSERQWQKLVDDQQLQDVPKVRVNPPFLGDLDPFSSKSIPQIMNGMAHFFESGSGKRQMGMFINMTYAKLWEVEQKEVLVAGGPGVRFKVKLRDMSRILAKWSKEEKKQFLVLRGSAASDLQEMTDDNLQSRVAGLMSQNPLHEPLEGCFLYSFNGCESEIPGNDRTFRLSANTSQGGGCKLDVLWKCSYGEFSIAGCPKFVRVREEA